MDDLTRHRKKRLEALIASPPYNGDRGVFMKHAQLSKGRVSQLLDPDESFGERSAMALAERLGLPDRWFEQRPAPEAAKWPFVILTPDQVNQLSEESLGTVENLALSLLKIEGAPPLRGVASGSVQTDTTVAPRSPGYEDEQEPPPFKKEQRGKRSADPGASRKTRNG